MGTDAGEWADKADGIIANVTEYCESEEEAREVVVRALRDAHARGRREAAGEAERMADEEDRQRSVAASFAMQHAAADGAAVLRSLAARLREGT